jgi:hypothetical protein
VSFREVDRIGVAKARARGFRRGLVRTRREGPLQGSFVPKSSVPHFHLANPGREPKRQTGGPRSLVSLCLNLRSPVPDLAAKRKEPALARSMPLVDLSPARIRADRALVVKGYLAEGGQNRLCPG